jgi:hypothetical protein
MDDFKVAPYYSITPDEVSEENSTTHFGYLFDIEGIRICNMRDSSRAMLKNPSEVLEPARRLLRASRCSAYSATYCLME